MRLLRAAPDLIGARVVGSARDRKGLCHRAPHRAPHRGAPHRLRAAKAKATTAGGGAALLSPLEAPSLGARVRAEASRACSRNMANRRKGVSLRPRLDRSKENRTPWA